jgi:hypothetical protein
VFPLLSSLEDLCGSFVEAVAFPRLKLGVLRSDLEIANGLEPLSIKPL